ncbi:MAG TPA: hypothetical protein VKW78_01690 [Terriglobales bacterium]|nr:hypothetical protein [Terriglobales bacterium]
MDKLKLLLAHLRNIKDPKLRTAWAVAITADIAQWVLFPFFAAGAPSPLDDLLDVAVAIILTRLLGWHWAFLPTFAAELLPGLDLLPTWTAAVFFISRSLATDVEPEIIPPGTAASR